MDVYFSFIYVFYFLYKVNTQQTEWGSWSSCTKTCDIGTQRRTRNLSSGVIESQEQYCNTHYCQDIQTCNSSSDCYPHIGGGRAICTDNICRCTLGSGYNIYNCFPEVGNCVIREDPPTALGYKDPSATYPYSYKLNSCTTADNSNYEVHVIGIYGDRTYNIYEVFVRQRGPITKPVVLVLTSYETTHWRVDTSVSLHKVLYGGYNIDSSTVQKLSSSQCDFISIKRSDLTSGYGRDTGGGHTKQLLTMLVDEFGPITTFTGYYELSSSPTSRVILNIGGNPLSLKPQDYTIDDSSAICIPASTTAPLSTTSPISSSVGTVEFGNWGSWTACSKPCDIGTQSRHRYLSTGLIESQEQYCNTQYCIDKKTCNTSSWDCYPHIGDGRANCINNTCYCTLGPGYNLYNCFPEVGHCVIREDPPTALGYKDPSATYPNYGYKLNSCTTADNSNYEVHVIGIYGDRTYNIYEVFVRQRGPITKPVILVLTSYETTHWKVDTSVSLHQVLYGGYNIDSSTVQKLSSSKCDFILIKRSDLTFGHGKDTGGGHTKQFLTQLVDEFGPITTFTGYYELNSSPTSRIILNIGGNPLSVNPQNYTIDDSSAICIPASTTAPLSTTTQISSSVGTVEFGNWGSWTACSKPCDIGTQSRHRYQRTGLIESQEQYCNTQYCIDKKTCITSSWDCYPHIRDGRANCINNICYCTLGLGYNLYNCFPEVGNCVIREDPPTALGYKDPSATYPNYGYKLNSCTTADNFDYEVHVIGIYGDRIYNIYEVFVRQRGPVTKPVILVLTSYETTHWKIDTSVSLHKVLYSGYNIDSSTVQEMHSSFCDFNVTKRSDLPYGFGTDTGGGYTSKLLTQLVAEFGPITSFTGYYELSSTPTSRIFLQIGGDPLAIVQPKHKFDEPAMTCMSPTRPPIYTTTFTSQHDSLKDTAEASVVMIVGAAIGSSLITLLVLAFVIVIWRRRTTDSNIQGRGSGTQGTANVTHMYMESIPCSDYDVVRSDSPPAYEDLFNPSPPNVYDRLHKPEYTDRTYVYLR